MLLACLGLGACAGKNAPILVAQSGIIVADSVGKISDAAKQLQQAQVLPATAALGLQEALLQVNTKMEPLPALLRTIDNLQKAGSSTTVETDRAIALLTVVSQDISVVLAGVPVAGTAQQLITLVRAADKTVSDVLTEVAKIRGRE